MLLLQQVELASLSPLVQLRRTFQVILMLGHLKCHLEGKLVLFCCDLLMIYLIIPSPDTFGRYGHPLDTIFKPS